MAEFLLLTLYPFTLNNDMVSVDFHFRVHDPVFKEESFLKFLKNKLSKMCLFFFKCFSCNSCPSWKLKFQHSANS